MAASETDGTTTNNTMNAALGVAQAAAPASLPALDAQRKALEGQSDTAFWLLIAATVVVFVGAAMEIIGDAAEMIRLQKRKRRIPKLRQLVFAGTIFVILGLGWEGWQEFVGGNIETKLRQNNTEVQSAERSTVSEVADAAQLAEVNATLAGNEAANAMGVADAANSVAQRAVEKVRPLPGEIGEARTQIAALNRDAALAEARLVRDERWEGDFVSALKPRTLRPEMLAQRLRLSFSEPPTTPVYVVDLGDATLAHEMLLGLQHAGLTARALDRDVANLSDVTFLYRDDGGDGPRALAATLCAYLAQSRIRASIEWPLRAKPGDALEARWDFWPTGIPNDSLVVNVGPSGKIFEVEAQHEMEARGQPIPSLGRDSPEVQGALCQAN